MGTKLSALARTVACLALAITSVGAAPIYHAHYHGRATLISDALTSTTSVTRDDQGETTDYSVDACSLWGCSLGQFVYRVLPGIQLPAGSRVLSAELHQWGYWEIELSQTVSVSPVDPAKPYLGEYLYSLNMISHADPRWWDHQYSSFIDDPWPCPMYDGTGGGYGGHCFDSHTDYAGLVSLYGWPAPLPFNEVDVMMSWGYGRGEGGRNSVTVVTDTFTLSNSSAFWDLRIDYEAPIPEPATAPLFLGGAASFLLLRRARRTRQS